MNFNNSTKYDNFENFIHGEYEIRFELNLAYYTDCLTAIFIC